MKRSVRVRGWLWVVSIGLVLCVVVGVCVFFITLNRATPNTVALEISNPSVVVSSSSPTIEPAETVVDSPPQLPHLDLPPGSVEEACGLLEFPPYREAVDAGTSTQFKNRALESAECQTALENHVKAIHPYFWADADDYQNQAATFVLIDEPLTFERIFADPAGDLLRVEGALSRPECLLKGDETNWDLKEICHAGSFFNYALINHFCFGGGVKKRQWKTSYSGEDHSAFKHNRSLWKHSLEDDWVAKKCEKLDPMLALAPEHKPELHALVMSLRSTNWPHDSQEQLIKLAARLGDDAAGMTWTASQWRRIGGNLPSGGYQFGRFAELFASEEWQSLITAGTIWRGFDTGHANRQFSIENFLHALKLLARDGGPSTEQHEEIQFDWQAVVQYVCVPIYIHPNDIEAMGIEPVKLQSCKEIVEEVHQLGTNSPAVLAAINKFEKIAIELGVYE
ncbi:MAG: hypothetical protein F4Z01_01685 [Gammaproteobacteria bacterium]|nr:hypothetical protein [Gammaproteobacteria bacterium]MYF37843.1 hypothetical protein [Gammaproteobacteria bacterium]